MGETIAFLQNADQGLLTSSNLPAYLENWKNGYLEAYREFSAVKDTYRQEIASGNDLPLAANEPCTNVGFEDGIFNGWTGSVAEHCITHNQVATCNEATGFFQHCIMTPAMTDPLVPVLPAVLPGSRFSLRLGNTANGGHTARLARLLKSIPPTFCSFTDMQ